MIRGALLFGMTLVLPLPAFAADSPVPDGASRAFDQPPESETVLAENYGGSGGGGDRLRRLVDPDAIGFSQQVGRISTVAMDNWWAQTGASLIDNNLLAR